MPARPRPIDKDQRRITLLRRHPRPPHALSLNAVIGIANTCRIKKGDRNPVQINGDADDIACCTSCIGHNRHISASQMVHQGGFTGIDRTDQRHSHAAAHTFAKSAIIKGCTHGTA